MLRARRGLRPSIAGQSVTSASPRRSACSRARVRGDRMRTCSALVYLPSSASRLRPSVRCRTDAKIARMEAKLRQLESTAAAEGSGSASAGAGAGASLSGHPSLPPKPVAGPIIPVSRRAPTNAASAPAVSRDRGRGRPLPVLPIKPSIQTISRPANTPLATASTSTPSPPRALPSRKPALTGIRMVKGKPNKSSG